MRARQRMETETDFPTMGLSGSTGSRMDASFDTWSSQVQRRPRGGFSAFNLETEKEAPQYMPVRRQRIKPHLLRFYIPGVLDVISKRLVRTLWVDARIFSHWSRVGVQRIRNRRHVNLCMKIPGARESLHFFNNGNTHLQNCSRRGDYRPISSKVDRLCCFGWVARAFA